MLTYFLIILTLMLSPVALIVVSIISITRLIQYKKAKKLEKQNSEVSTDEKK